MAERWIVDRRCDPRVCGAPQRNIKALTSHLFTGRRWLERRKHGTSKHGTPSQNTAHQSCPRNQLSRLAVFKLHPRTASIVARAPRVVNASALLDGLPDVCVALSASERPSPLRDAKGWVNPAAGISNAVPSGA
jgi:hypothetical protein